MIKSVEELEGIFDYIGQHLSRPCSVYLIGGAALMIHGVIDQTEDVDICTDPETTNYIISDLREADNLWTCNTGPDKYLFLRIDLGTEDVKLDLFINEEYKLLNNIPMHTVLQHNKLTVQVPNLKELIMLKDLKIRGLLRTIQGE